MPGGNTPRLMITAPSSASGKTTVACGVIRAFVQRGLAVSAFKSGPDFIDPMFHRKAVGAEWSSNLDLFLSSEQDVCTSLARYTKDIAVIEGAMGFYDGLAGKSTKASAYALAKVTKTPVVLIVDASGMSVSVAAQIYGFLHFYPDSGIQAVILNRVSPMLYPDLKLRIEQSCGVKVAGYLPRMPDCAIESRHLGLVTAGEVQGIAEKLDQLAKQVEKTINLRLLLGLAQSAPKLTKHRLTPACGGCEPVSVAVARDDAFCFYYEESLSLLKEMGARLLPFSPLADETIPQGADALLLGGGYPELHAEQLSQNSSMRKSVKAAVLAGMPVVAECGGFLYLHESLEDMRGRVWPMAGVIAASAYKTEKLQRFGYARLTAKEDNLVCAANETLAAHEFHYWESTNPGNAFSAKKPLRNTGWVCVHASTRMYAGFAHLYLAGNHKAAKRFLQEAGAFRKERAG